MFYYNLEKKVPTLLKWEMGPSYEASIVGLKLLGRILQSVTCLTADLGIASSIPVRFNTFAEIDLRPFSSLQLNQEFQEGLLSVTSERI